MSLNNPTLKSNCCNAEINPTHGNDFGGDDDIHTWWNECTKCKKPCDLNPSNSTTLENSQEKAEKKKYPITQEIKLLKLYINEFEKLLMEIMKPKPFWCKNYSIKDILLVQQTLSEKKVDFWSVVYKTYPQLTFLRGSISVTDQEIIYYPLNHGQPKPYK